jgi:ABC-2 type transport system ATP-binding protein
MNPIEAVALSRAFPGGRPPAVDGVTFSIAEAEIVALAGRNGAGKSTLLDVLSTLLLPSSGAARIAGHDLVTDTAAARRAMGFAPAGERGLYRLLTARQNLEFYAALHPSIRDARGRVAEVAELLGLADFADRQVRHLSDGMQQKVTIARALLGRPRVLLLDEPMRALDIHAARALRDAIVSLVQSRHVQAVLYATHDIEAGVPMGARALLLEAGRLVFDGDPARVAALMLKDERA